MKTSTQCEHCGATMEWVKGPAPNVDVHTYHAICRRLDLPSVRGLPGSIWPQRVGNDCYRNIPTGATP